MNIIAHKLCSLQGRLFELSARKGFASNEFVKAYMNSEIAAKFNSAYDRSQWMGEEYLLDELIQTCHLKQGEVYSYDVMFWMGYIYAHWSIVYGDPCNKIIKMANPRVMAENYAGLHTVSVDLAVQDLKMQYWSHGSNGARLADELCKKVIKDALNSRNDITEYQRFLNETGTDILFCFRNEAIRREYKRQLNHYQQYIEQRMYSTYIDYILDLIEKADISPKDKAEYSYVVKDIMRRASVHGFTNEQFMFLDSLESKLKKSVM